MDEDYEDYENSEDCEDSDDEWFMSYWEMNQD